MSDKRGEAKHKIDRRLGVNLWGRAKSPVNNNDHNPGLQVRRRPTPNLLLPLGPALKCSAHP